MTRSYPQQLAIAIDQLLNTLLAGWADETLSSRAYRCRDKRRWRVVMRTIDAVLFWQDAHCFNAFLREIKGGQLPRSMRHS